MDWPDQLLVVFKVVIAMVLGGTIGLEREIARKPAGIRTHMLVAGAAALLVALGEVIIIQYRDTQQDELLRVDPIRVMEAIIVGISFIGAGTIIRRRAEERVEFLTTAASILFTAGIGMAVALDQYVLAAALTGAVLFVVLALGLLVRSVKNTLRERSSRSKG